MKLGAFGLSAVLGGFAAVAGLVGCAPEARNDAAETMPQTEATGNTGQMATARAELKDKDGNNVGTATFQEMAGGVQLTLDARGLSQGEHGFHIHENGQCDAPDFTSAGEHFNPTNKEHGKDVPGGPHVGDMLNLEVGQDGMGNTTRMLDGATLQDGQMSVVGKALVIHAQPDDYKSQPSGDAGGRVACGVISR